MERSKILGKREKRRAEEIGRAIRDGRIENVTKREPRVPTEDELSVEAQANGADYPENAQKNPETDERIRKAQEYLFSGKAFKSKK